MSRLARALRRAWLLLIPALALAAAPGPIAPTAQLLNNSSTSGNPTYWPGGVGVFAATGTFGGATVTLEFLGPDGVTYLAAGSNTTLTAAGAGVFYLPQTMIEAVVSGGAPSALYAYASLVQKN